MMYKRRPPRRSSRAAKRRRVARRTVRVPRPVGMNRTGEMLFKRKQWLQVFQPTTASTLNFWLPLYFSLSQIQNAGELTALFDQYKICGLKFEFLPKFTEYAGDAAAPTYGQTKVHICYDKKTLTGYNPSGSYSSATFNNFMEQGRIKTVHNPNRGFSMYCRPVINKTIAGVYTNMWTPSQWLPTSSATINHYGFNLFFQDTNFTGAFGQIYDVFVTTYVKCRNLK